MKYFVLALLTMTFLCGCKPVPRYGTPETREAPEQKPPERQYTNESKAYRKPGLPTNARLRLGRIIESYLGSPYKGHYGDQDAPDCSQLVMEIYDRYNNTKLPRTVKRQFETGTKVSRKNVRFGDLVFFRLEGSRPSHVGIYIGNEEFVHASSSRGVIISDIDDNPWSNSLAGVRRILP